MKIYRPAFIRGECPHSTAQQITYFDCILLKISYLLFEFLLSQVVEWDTRHGCKTCNSVSKSPATVHRCGRFCILAEVNSLTKKSADSDVWIIGKNLFFL